MYISVELSVRCCWNWPILFLIDLMYTCDIVKNWPGVMLLVISENICVVYSDCAPCLVLSHLPCPGNDVYLIEEIPSCPQSPVSLTIWLSFNAHWDDFGHYHIVYIHVVCNHPAKFPPPGDLCADRERMDEPGTSWLWPPGFSDHAVWAAIITKICYVCPVSPNYTLCCQK